MTVLQQLLGEGSKIIVTESAEEALDLIGQFTEHDRPDLMLVDLRLPDNSGFEVLSAASSKLAVEPWLLNTLISASARSSQLGPND